MKGAGVIEENYRDWEEKQNEALRLMEGRSHFNDILIEIAAQHPLVDGRYPNAEFSARLDAGVVLFEKYRTEGRPAEIYVPGSRHVFDGMADEISLSSAGASYLEAKGIPSSVLHGNDLNHRYRGDSGVYGSADECFVASSYFKDQQFGALVCICSPAQMMRKTLHYIEFGVLPLNYTVPTRNAFHSYVFEAIYAVPRVLNVDATVDPESTGGQRLRRERKP